MTWYLSRSFQVCEFILPLFESAFGKFSDKAMKSLTKHNRHHTFTPCGLSTLSQDRPFSHRHMNRHMNPFLTYFRFGGETF